MWNEYEDRVIWDDLAPSLQAMIRSVQTSITTLNRLTPIVDNLVKLGDSTVTNNLVKIGNNTNITNNLVKLGDNNVTNNLMNVSNHNTEITNLINKEADITNITNIFGGSGSGGVMASWSGDPGKVAKTNFSGQLICDDLVYTIRAAGSAADVTTLSGIPLSLKDIFYSWDRISCRAGCFADTAPATLKTYQNRLDSGDVAARAAYSFDESKGIIFCLRNSDEWSCFLSNSLYKNFKMRFALNLIGAPTTGPWGSTYMTDDDGFFFVCGYMVDNQGCFHTLSVLRTGDTEGSDATTGGTADANTSHGVRFALVYDTYTAWPGKMGTKKEILTEVPLTTIKRTPYPNGWYNSYTLMEVEKNNTNKQIIAKTGDPVIGSKSGASLSYTFTWTFPASKPANWSQTMYDNINQMMTNESKIGFGTESNCCGFEVDAANSVNVMDIIEIYDLSTGQIKKYNSKTGTWEASVPIGDAIQPNSLVYSSYTKRLYYYRRDNNFVEIFTGG